VRRIGLGDHGFGPRRRRSFGLSDRRLVAVRGRPRPLAVYRSRLRGLERDRRLDGLPLVAASETDSLISIVRDPAVGAD